MIPTLSERLQARAHDPYWRSHPPAPWGLALETPVALQVLTEPSPEPAPLRGREWVLLLAIALLWLLEGLEALRQILERRRRAGGSPLPQRQGPDSRSRLGRRALAEFGAGDWLPVRAAVQGR
jgi:hypothetical protein